MVIAESSLGMEQAVGRFERDRYVVLEGALGSDQVAGLVEAVDRVWTQGGTICLSREPPLFICSHSADASLSSSSCSTAPRSFR